MCDTRQQYGISSSKLWTRGCWGRVNEWVVFGFSSLEAFFGPEISTVSVKKKLFLQSMEVSPKFSNLLVVNRNPDTSEWDLSLKETCPLVSFHSWESVSDSWSCLFKYSFSMLIFILHVEGDGILFVKKTDSATHTKDCKTSTKCTVIFQISSAELENRIIFPFSNSFHNLFLQPRNYPNKTLWPTNRDHLYFFLSFFFNFFVQFSSKHVRGSTKYQCFWGRP